MVFYGIPTFLSYLTLKINATILVKIGDLLKKVSMWYHHQIPRYDMVLIFPFKSWFLKFDPPRKSTFCVFSDVTWRQYFDFKMFVTNFFLLRKSFISIKQVHRILHGWFPSEKTLCWGFPIERIEINPPLTNSNIVQAMFNSPTLETIPTIPPLYLDAKTLQYTPYFCSNHEHKRHWKNKNRFFFIIFRPFWYGK